MKYKDYSLWLEMRYFIPNSIELFHRARNKKEAVKKFWKDLHKKDYLYLDLLFKNKIDSIKDLRKMVV